MGRRVEGTELANRILEDHRREPHRGLDGERLRVHLALHQVVEQQLVLGDPAETAATLARLQAEGLSRHLAVHAIGSVVSAEVFEVLQEGKRYDEARYLAGLRALSAAAFLADGAPDKP
jgi:hypothetical protein